MKQRTLNNQDGIALGPILFMIAILAILAGAIAAGSGGFTANANKENAKITAATLIHLLNDYKTGFDMILANEGNPFGMPITLAGSDGNWQIYDRSSPLYKAASDPFSSNGINITNMPSDYPILHPFAHITASDPPGTSEVYSTIGCTSDAASFQLGGTGGYDCALIIVAITNTDAKIDDSVCTQFLQQLGLNAQPTAVMDAASFHVNPGFANQPMLCNHMVESGYGFMEFWVILAPHFPGTCDPSICQ
jgi:hypothetical protein